MAEAAGAAELVAPPPREKGFEVVVPEEAGAAELAAGLPNILPAVPVPAPAP